MPWQPTQAQQMYGTGGVGLQGAASPFWRQPSANQDPFGASARFNSMYGGMTASRALQATNEGLNPYNPAAATGVAGPSSSVQPAPAKPSAPPAQAGAMNAAMPGMFNGNPTSGHPSSDNGFAPPMTRFPTGGGQKPAWAKPSMPGQPAAQPSPPQNMTRQIQGTNPNSIDPNSILVKHQGITSDMLNDPSVQSDLRNGIDPFAVGGVSAFGAGAMATADAANEPSAPAASFSAATGTPFAPKSASGGFQPKSLLANTASAATPDQFNYGGQSYSATKAKPANWSTMTNAQRNAWLTKNASVASSAQSTGLQALKGYDQFRDVVLPSDASGVTPTTVTPGMTAADFGKYGITGDLARLSEVGRNLYMQVNAPNQSGTATQGRQRDELIAQFDAVSKALAPYGITFGATNTQPTPGNGPLGGGGYGKGQEGPTDPTVPVPPTPPTPTPTVPTTPVEPGLNLDNGGVIGAPTPENVGTNLDLSNIGADEMSQQKKLLGELYKAYGDKAPAMFEALQSAAQQQNLDNNRQSAVNIFGGAVDAFGKNPLFTGVQDIASEMLKNPTTIPWDVIQNQRVSDIAKSGENAISDASIAANRRGVAPGAMTGIAGDIRRTQGNETARALGDIQIQKATTDRQMQDQAMRSGLAALAGTSGVQMSNVGNLANFIVGDPAQYGNPYSGLAAAFTNADAAQASIDQANQAGKFGWGDAAQFVGQVLPAILGSGKK